MALHLLLHFHSRVVNQNDVLATLHMSSRWCSNSGTAPMANNSKIKTASFHIDAKSGFCELTGIYHSKREAVILPSPHEPLDIATYICRPVALIPCKVYRISANFLLLLLIWEDCRKRRIIDLCVSSIYNTYPPLYLTQGACSFMDMSLHR